MEVEQEEDNQEANIFPIAEQASKQPSPPLIGGYIPNDDMVMDISNLTYDQLKSRIVQERWKYFSNDLVHHFSIHTKRMIVPKTKNNQKTLIVVHLAFTKATKENTNFLMEENKQLFMMLLYGLGQPFAIQIWSFIKK